MELGRIVAGFASAAEFLAAFDAQVAHGGLFVPGVEAAPETALAACTLCVAIAGAEVAEVPAQLASKAPGLGVAVIFPEKPAALHALAARLRGQGEQHEGPGTPAAEGEGAIEGAQPSEPASGRASGPESAEPPPRARELLSPQEKMQRALGGDREQRFALLRDQNKQLHAMVLKNPRTSLEEAHWAAKLTTLSPDALKLIAEHAEWGANPAVATALVRNPKTPIPVALKLLPRIPAAELKAIAKSQGRPQIVQAARRLLHR